MSASRVKELENRIDHLNSLIGREVQSKNPSQTYIDDLQEDIERCKSQLQFHVNNPSGVEFVNGV